MFVTVASTVGHAFGAKSKKERDPRTEVSILGFKLIDTIGKRRKGEGNEEGNEEEESR